MASKGFKPKTSGVVVADEAPETDVMETPETDETTENTNTAEGVEETPDTPETDSEVNTNPDIVQKAPVKSVRVLPKRDHTCVIGGVRYFFKAGVCQNVPLEVKNILTKADLLSPL